MGEIAASPPSRRDHKMGRSVASHGGRVWVILLVCFTSISRVSCWFYEGTNIVEVDATVLKERVTTAEDEVWMVEWFHPGCPHCIAFKDTYIKAASLAKDSGVLFGAVDCSKDFSSADNFGIHSLPSMKFFGPNEHQGEMYLGSHNAQEIADAALLYLKTNGTKQYEGNWAYGKAQLQRARFTLHSYGLSDFVLSFTIVFSIGFSVLFRHKVVEGWLQMRKYWAKRGLLARESWSHCA